MTELTESERENIVDDIVAHKVEETKGEIPYNQLRNHESMLMEMEDKELVDQWHSTVGEWLISRYEDYNIEEQFNNIKKGEEVDYGYTHVV